MALTITQSPQAFTPSDNPVTWVLSSTNTSQSNFYFLIEVMIDGVVKERHRIFPEFGSKAHFNAKSISERYAVTNSSNYYANTVLKSISIKVTEYFNGSAGSTITSGSVKIWKSGLKKSKFQGFDYTDYLLTTGSTGVKYLTDFPRGEDKAKGNEMKRISLLNDGSNVTTSFRTYTSAGVQIDQQNVLSTSGTNILNIACGVGELIDDISLDFTNASYYTLQSTTGIGMTEEYRINIDEACDYSTAKRIHVVNSLGGIDAFTFGLVSREKIKVKSFGFERQFGGFSGSGVFEYDIKEGTVIDYLKHSSKELETTSDWLSQTVQNWITSELYMTPIVWIEGDTELFRCKITNKDSEYKIKENDMLFQETVKIQLETETSFNG